MMTTKGKYNVVMIGFSYTLAQNPLR